MKEMTKLIKVRQTIQMYFTVIFLSQDMYGMLKNDDPNLAAKGRVHLILYCTIME